MHLLLSPESIAWHDDGQRCQPQLAERQAFFQATAAWLALHQLPYQVVQGDWEQRRCAAFAAVERLLKA
ncbi:hypothetical protein D3C79_944300 [compost metagenome]